MGWTYGTVRFWVRNLNFRFLFCQITNELHPPPLFLPQVSAPPPCSCSRGPRSWWWDRLRRTASTWLTSIFSISLFKKSFGSGAWNKYKKKSLRMDPDPHFHGIHSRIRILLKIWIRNTLVMIQDSKHH